MYAVYILLFIGKGERGVGVGLITGASCLAGLMYSVGMFTSKLYDTMSSK